MLKLDTKGRHFILDVWGVSSNLLSDSAKLLSILLEAVVHANAKVVTHIFRKFTPEGISGVIIIAESHLSVHTWPSKGYASFDIYTCGDHTMPEKAFEYIIQSLTPTKVYTVKMERGLQEGIRVESKEGDS